MIMTVIGNRPQFIKAAAVSHLLRERLDETIINTGQHYDRALAGIFFEELGVPAPDHDLGVGSGSHAAQTAAMVTALEHLVDEVGPAAILVYGDTNSTLAAALVAAKASVPLAHVEAGMRSFDRAMPEEINRVVADALSDLLLCPTPVAVQNLENEGMGGRARMVGDVMCDVALRFGPVAEQRSQVLDRLELAPREYLVATAHRAGNVDDPANLERLIAVLARAAERAPVVFPVHPRTRARLDSGGLGAAAGVRLIEPLGYLDFTKLVRNAQAVLTDSGGLQKEAYIGGVPCVTLRNTTEWVETVELGWNRLVGLDADAAQAALDDLAPKLGTEPDLSVYGAGRAAERVTSELATWVAGDTGRGRPFPG